MPGATLTELIDSREQRMERDETGELRLEELTLHYVLQGTSSESTARTLLENSTATTYDSLVRDQIRLEPIEVDTVNTTGRWDVEVDYVMPEAQEAETGESRFSFDTGGGTKHITQSLGTVASYGIAGDNPPDFKGAINVRGRAGDMTVEGVDIVVPQYSFSETHWIGDGAVTPTYKGRLFALTGTTNNAPFKGCAIGECLFLNAAGSKRGDADWEITFNFTASPNSDDIRTPELIALNFNTAIPKKGWEYFWVRYRETDDTTAKAIVKRPIGVYIEKVYEADNFAMIGIGT